MKHSSIRDLYGYWNQRRGARTAPDRADIDPTAIPRVLADTFLLGTNADGEFLFRLAGTRVCALFCRELKGERFAELFDRASHEEIEHLLGIVGDEALGSVAGITAQLGDGSSADLELLLLPLRHRGRTDSRILGVLAPVTASYWIGAIPVASLTIGTLRHLDMAGATAAAAPPAPMPFPAGRVRHGLIVYDGGRS